MENTRLPSNFLLRFFFFTYLLSLAYAVFTPKEEFGNNWFKFLGDSYILESIVNLFLLIPLAYFLGRLFLGLSLVKKLMLIGSFSISIELIQVFIPGRVSDLKDFLLNTLGGYFFLLIQKMRIHGNSDIGK